jgi:hypothetical protein
MVAPTPSQQRKKDKNGDWNIFGKYTGTTNNNMKDTTQLANINFSSVSQPNILTQITKIKQFKPFEEIKGVCTSLEEWALCILYPNEPIRLNELYKRDSEMAQRLDREISSQREKHQKMFKITKTFFPSAKDNIDSNTETATSKNLTLTQTEMTDYQAKN